MVSRAGLSSTSRKALIDREALGRGDGHGVAVVEADVVVPIADLVVPERHTAARRRCAR